ncbi:LuxR C-terminal-related transcriptional regulator [Lysinibacillus telephonicus]|uniref:helix-turn-helix transcriptional regulator n=1 Tax=Lysinibacillus telephonicus TaxID=1714840 RepID=UPI0031FD1757
MGKGQLAVNKFSLDAMITDYHWMLNAVKEIRAELGIGAKTAQYGIEATLPKGQGNTSDPVELEVARRAKKIKRLKEYEMQLMEVQYRIEKVKGVREIQVLDWMLDGKSMRWIGKVMGLSHTHVQNIKVSIVEQMMG